VDGGVLGAAPPAAAGGLATGPLRLGPGGSQGRPCRRQLLQPAVDQAPPPRGVVGAAHRASRGGGVGRRRISIGTKREGARKRKWPGHRRGHRTRCLPPQKRPNKVRGNSRPSRLECDPSPWPPPRSGEGGKRGACLSPPPRIDCPAPPLRFGDCPAFTRWTSQGLRGARGPSSRRAGQVPRGRSGRARAARPRAAPSACCLVARPSGLSRR
jgi:hypothetical protein